MLFLARNIINETVNSEDDIWQYINGKTVTILGNKTTLKTLNNNIVVHQYEMDIGQMLMNIFANPNTAYILFLIGAALIYLEFQAPGGFIAGSIGALALILAGIGFQIIPINLVVKILNQLIKYLQKNFLDTPQISRHKLLLHSSK